MAPKLMQERISHIEEEPLMPGEILLMKDKIIKQLRIYLPGYLLLIGIGVFILLRGPNVLNDRNTFPLQRMEITDETKVRFWTVAPYFCGFLFVISTIFFGKYYFQSVHPIIKDIKNKKKLLIFYRPKKSEMPFFNQYYISTPLSYFQQIKVSKADFESIKEEDMLCLETGPDSNFLLKLRNKDRRIHTDDLTL